MSSPRPRMSREKGADKAAASSIPASSSSAPTPSSSSQRIQRATRESLDTLGSAINRARLSPSSCSSRGSIHDEQQPAWWESVLPPGQLAERLRRAQRSPASSRGPTPSSSQRASPRSMPATPAEPADDMNESDGSYRRRRRPREGEGRQHDSQRATSSQSTDAAKRTRKMRSMTAMTSLAPPATAPRGQSLRGGTEMRQSSSRSGSTRSSFSFNSSTSSSGNEDSPPSGRSPSILSEEWAARYFPGLKAGGHIKSPPNGHVVTRSRSNRRSRVLSEDGHSLGLGLSRDEREGSSHTLDEHFRSWNARQSLNSQMVASVSSPSSLAQHGDVGMRTLPRSSSGYSFANAFVDTPEASSEEEREYYSPEEHRGQYVHEPKRRTSELHHAAIKPRRSSLRPNERMYASHDEHSNDRSFTERARSRSHRTAPRHVSFFPSVELVDGNSGVHTMSLGRQQGRNLSMAATAGERSHAPANLPLESRSTLQFPRGQDEDVRLHAHSNVRGPRIPSHSAPTSPHHTKGFPAAADRSPFASGRFSGPVARKGADAKRAAAVSQADDYHASSAEMALLSSLGAAQAQLASARDLASALTRQLSAPLRPIFHVTLFLSISSMAFMALSGFLVAGYLATVWDDVNSHSRALQRNVSSARRGVGARVNWTRHILAGSNWQAPRSDSAEPAQGAGSGALSPDEEVTPPFWRYTLGLPASLAHLAPANVFETFGVSVASENEKSAPKRKTASKGASATSSDEDRPRAKSSRSSPFQDMPPRPPLSSLLPSIALTFVIALGAGLASFFASRSGSAAASATTARAGATHSGANSPSPRASVLQEPSPVGASPFVPHVRSTSFGASGGKQTQARSGFRSSAARRAQSSAASPASVAAAAGAR